MANETRRLDAICSLIVDCPHSTPVWTDSGFIVLRNQNIKNGKLDLSAPSFTDEEHFIGRNRRAKPSFGDIVITREAPMGDVCMIPEGLECCLGQRQVLLRPDPKLAVSRFLLYALQSQSVQRQISWNEGTGSTVSNIRIPVLQALEIPMPPIQVQRAIAHIFGVLDDKIELNRKQNETLEAMARALFKAWFVDFEPVRAKMDGRWQRGQSLPGLTAHLYDLFPDRLVDSELGEIPEGWEIGRVSDFLSLAYGKSLPAGSRNPGVVPVYGSGGVTGYHDTSLLDVETVIVGRKGTVGSLYWEPLPCFPIDTVFYVQPLVPLPFCYHLLESLPLSDMNTDAAVPGLNRENVYRLEVVAPPQLLIKEFSDLARKFRDQIFRLHAETRILAQLRDTLLPKLLSGELRVLDPERIIGALI